MCRSNFQTLIGIAGAVLCAALARFIALAVFDVAAPVGAGRIRA